MSIKRVKFISSPQFFRSMDYEAMLDRGKTKLPEIAIATERFTVPKVTGHLEGNKTVISKKVYPDNDHPDSQESICKVPPFFGEDNQGQKKSDEDGSGIHHDD